MESFRTEIRLPGYDLLIGHGEGVLLIGSCFAENLHARLSELKFDTVCNPTGILFNPLSAAACLQRLASGREFDPGELTFRDGLWVSFAHHGSFSGTDREQVLENINARFRQGCEALQKTKVVVITFGTAWAWERNGEVVANCHKFPENAFTKYRMSASSIETAFANLYPTALAGKKVILTVSPVRHLGDGMIDNSMSKATLRVAAGNLSESLPDTLYFPSYEMMMDDLRDYRFYERDMAHPTAQAVDYILDRFSEAFFSPQTRELNGEIQKIVRAAAHRPLHPGTEAAMAFRRQMARQTRDLMAAHPEIDLKAELAQFES